MFALHHNKSFNSIILAVCLAVSIPLVADLNITEVLLAKIEAKYNKFARKRVESWQQLLLTTPKELSDLEKLEAVNNFFNLKLVLNKIYSLGCRNLLVEGGKSLTDSFLKTKLFNQFFLFKSPIKLGKNAKLNISSQLNQLSFKYKKKSKLNAFTGKDIVYIYSK